MNAPRLIAPLLVFAVAAGGLAAQRPPAPSDTGAPTAVERVAADTAAAEEVYVPERASAPGASGPAAPAAANATPATASATGVPAAAPGDAKSAAPNAKGAAAATPPPLSPRFQQVRDRIGALLSHRSESLPPADPRKNPFRPAGAAPADPVKPGRGGAPVAAATPKPVTAGTDYQQLQAAAATLKVSGTIQINGVGHLIINQSPYKEGDVLNARLKGQVVPIRVKHISRYSYTLSLNNAELSVKY